MQIRSCVAVSAILLLSGCGYYDAREARDPLGRSSLIGQTLPDILSAMGKPDSVLQTGPDTAIMQYTRKDTSTGVKASLSLLGSIQIGGGGGCDAVLTILREGIVADAKFTKAFSNSLFSPLDESCGPLVAEALRHPNSTGLPRGYDAFVYLLPELRKP